MASTRKQADNTNDPATQGDEALRARRAEDDAQMFQSASDRDESSWGKHEKVSPEPTDAPPTVGKTSGRGHQAERPSPVSERKQANKPPVEVARSGKPPAETPRAPAHRGKPRAAGWRCHDRPTAAA